MDTKKEEKRSHMSYTADTDVPGPKVLSHRNTLPRKPTLSNGSRHSFVYKPLCNGHNASKNLTIPILSQSPLTLPTPTTASSSRTYGPNDTDTPVPNGNTGSTTVSMGKLTIGTITQPMARHRSNSSTRSI